MTFAELGLSADLLRAVEDAGYVTPTPIQAQAIPTVLMGRDVLGCAQTGTGKTAGFTLPMIEILANGRAKARMPRSLILEPTRELAAQVSENFETYGKYHKLNMALLIGGESFTDQVKKLDRGVDVLIATPGRMIDLFERGSILLSDIKVLVIDEADRMLDMGFIPDIERIVSLLPKIRQTLMFSATMPPEIRRLADQFLMNPKEISVAPPASPATTVTQALCIVDEVDKRKALRHIIKTEEVKNAFIFCNRKRDVGILFKSLERHGFNCGALHGDLPQHIRTATLDAFRNDQLSLLVCSDVAARGLDIGGVSHVFNFDVPFSAEDYVHRIGRTGRAGRSGRAFTIATPDDGKLVAAIEALIGREVPRIMVDGLDNLQLAEGDGRRGRGGRGGGADRRGKGRGEPRRRPEPRPTVEAEAPVEVVAAPPAPREDRPARDDRRRRGDERKRSRPRDELAAGVPAAVADVGPVAVRGQPHPYGEARRRRRDDDDLGDPVVGFGDHVPAFMLRVPRLPAVEGA
jgi:superfamily II DNA/RNA helicase